MISQKELTITRIFNAPRRLVWRAWTDADYLKQWFGPESFTTPVCTVDLRADGSFHLAMRSPEGRDYWVKGIYVELSEPERIIYKDHFSDPEGNIVSPSKYGMSPDFPEELLITVIFEETEDGRTRMRIAMPSPRGKEGDDMEQGWNECFDKLAELVEKS